MTISQKLDRLERAARRASEELAAAVTAGELKPLRGDHVVSAQAILAAALDDVDCSGRRARPDEDDELPDRYPGDEYP